MPIRKKRLLIAAGAASLALGVGMVVVPSAFASGGNTTDIQLLAINDFHGNLEPPTGSSGQLTELDDSGKEHTIDAGGSEYLATDLAKARKHHKDSTTVAAGDLIGASPFTSAAFHDEPTIEAMNKMKLEVTSVGNHEFDEGFTELKRMQDGGCHPTDGCADPKHKFKGAKFHYLGANVDDKDSKQPVLPPVWVKNYSDGARVGFIGMTLHGTGDIISHEGNENLEFADEVKTANFYTKVLEMTGVNSIVVLVHEGGMPSGKAYNYDCDADGPGSGISGPIKDIAKNLDPQIDAVISGHTHQAYTCNIPDPDGKDRLVTSGSSFGRLYTEMDMKYDFKTKDIVRTSVKAKNHAVTRDVKRDPTQTKLIDKYKKLAEPIANKKVGYISADIPLEETGTKESALGDLIADAQKDQTAGDDVGKAQLALMNPGGVRADLLYKQSGSEGDGVVTYGEAFTVQPFANTLTTLDLTGKQIITALQQQYSGDNEKSPKVLQPSKGFAYTVDTSKTGADKIVTDSIELDGKKLDESATYRVTVNSFLAGGGDGFKVLAEGKNPLVGEDDLAALQKWFADNSSESKPVDPPKTDRITFK
ncbi:MAG TPA: bifunctional metallophosphatase/5'-nucleotidase [Stackebrandtia sp.]|jgi:5'-nucleotidase|uniref:bifunctional metallophosphatase/5'-nucleotidase n=1 Tax=Stackebrandtia sp. TaxID=2023065 RepID=UPI002D43EFCA|nr:bifunctional metallophosphatase/5'-nucleotidase [Stackebrandtia sp.]HZE38361.1 bifunctional metallophosphatase/5'-nucleotidase [Stackebrandtia sp.]